MFDTVIQWTLDVTIIQQSVGSHGVASIDNVYTKAGRGSGVCLVLKNGTPCISKILFSCAQILLDTPIEIVYTLYLVYNVRRYLSVLSLHSYHHMVHMRG